jgi:hypothetical protein
MRSSSQARPPLSLTAIVLVCASALLIAAAIPAGALAAGGVFPSPPRGPQFAAQAIFNGDQLEHTTPAGTEALSAPDDITFLNGHIFVGFQNGVGPQGQPSATGNVDSTIVELDVAGHPLHQWDIVGKCDGVTADPITGDLIATVNEDANSSLYTIDPISGEVIHYAYNEPLPSDGGTDAISIYHGLVLISASAPGTTGLAAPQATYPAVYEANLDAADHVATVTSLFGDEASASPANLGARGPAVSLALTDPDSNEDVPLYAPRFAGDFMLTSQGDQQQIFVQNAGQPDQSLSVLNLSGSVDDTAWPSVPWGALYVTDNSAGTVNRIVGPFTPGSVFVADTPCDENSAPATCPGPGYPPNYLGRLNPWTGVITPVALSGESVQAQGMLFVP